MRMQTAIGVILFVILIGIGVTLVGGHKGTAPAIDQKEEPMKVTHSIQATGTVVIPQVFEAKNSVFMLDKELVTLVNGESKIPAAPGSASVVATQYFGNEARGDLNGDGKDDIAFLVTQNSGGSGTFYYVVAAISSGDLYKQTLAVLLGDRIAPQTTEIKDGKLIVNYAIRKKGEAMSATPSVGVSKYFTLGSTGLVENKK